MKQPLHQLSVFLKHIHPNREDAILRAFDNHLALAGRIVLMELPPHQCCFLPFFAPVRPTVVTVSRLAKLPRILIEPKEYNCASSSLPQLFMYILTNANYAALIVLKGTKRVIHVRPKVTGQDNFAVTLC